MQVPRGLFLVTCTRTRAWTLASGPRTLLSARGTNTRVPKPVFCPSRVAKLPFQAVFPGRLRTAGRIRSWHQAASWAKVRPGATTATGPALNPHPGHPAPQSPVGTHPEPSCSSGPSLHTPFQSAMFPTKSWLCVNSFTSSTSSVWGRAPFPCVTRPVRYPACFIYGPMHTRPGLLFTFHLQPFLPPFPPILLLPLKGWSCRALAIL